MPIACVRPSGRGRCAAAVITSLVVLAVGAVPAARAGSPDRTIAHAASKAGVEATFDHPGDRNGGRPIKKVEDDVISSAKVGSLMAVSVYRIFDPSFAAELVAAAHRGVHVEVLLNGGNGCTKVNGCPQPAVQILQQLNTINHKDPKTWVKTCDGGGPKNGDATTAAGHGCIGQGLDHNKFIAVSRDTDFAGGSPSSLVLQASTNNTNGQYIHAWNDALEISDRPTVYRDYLRYFDRMVARSASSAHTAGMYFNDHDGTSNDTKTIAQHDIETWSFPRAASDDPVAAILRRIPTARRCRNSVKHGETGPGKTHVYAAIAFIGGRPRLMRQVVSLQNAGCDVQVIYSTITRHDRTELTDAGVQIFQACTPADAADKQTPQFLHSKFFIVDGSDSTVGANRRIVYTGSENWNDQSLTNADNRMLRFVEPASATSASATASRSPLFDAYLARWNTIVAAVRANGQPTGDRCAHATDY